MSLSTPRREERVRREKKGQPGSGLEQPWMGKKEEQAERTERSGHGAGVKARPCGILGLREAHPGLVGARSQVLLGSRKPETER